MDGNPIYFADPSGADGEPANPENDVNGAEGSEAINGGTTQGNGGVTGGGAFCQGCGENGENIYGLPEQGGNTGGDVVFGNNGTSTAFSGNNSGFAAADNNRSYINIPVINLDFTKGNNDPSAQSSANRAALNNKGIQLVGNENGVPESQNNSPYGHPYVRINVDYLMAIQAPFTGWPADLTKSLSELFLLSQGEPKLPIKAVQQVVTDKGIVYAVAVYTSSDGRIQFRDSLRVGDKGDSNKLYYTIGRIEWGKKGHEIIMIQK
jgi:hypothetical protein